MTRQLPCVVWITILAGLAAFGCARAPVSSSLPATNLGARSHPLFRDVAEEAGIKFTHDTGASGKFYYIENTPAGCAFLDYDSDGFIDVLLIQSGPSDPPPTTHVRPTCALYHNNGDGTFTDVTRGSGLDHDFGYLQGVTTGDYDNDGYPDVLLTGYGGIHLLHNQHGSGAFTDVTQAMRLDRAQGYATSAAFGDYDNDGKLDLYVCYYVPWSWKTNLDCRVDGQLDYCSPEVYEPATHRLFHNAGSFFTDVSRASGIDTVAGRGLGAAFLDYDEDGREDIFVANDLTPNMLWHNNGDGTFTNMAVRAGCAYDESGSVMAGMGIGVADYDHSGHESVFVGNFSNKPNMLYRNTGGLFKDESYSSGLALPHMHFLTFGTEFMDYDADGWPDLFVVNGHVQASADRKLEGITLKERKQLFHNNGAGGFTEITDPGGLGDLSAPTVGRGLAVGDFDNDGRLDVLVSSQNSPAQLFRNLDQSGNHWVSFLTVGTRSNREGRHARFEIIAGRVRQTSEVRSGSSYLSSSDRRVYFGLGSATVINSVGIRWPSGKHDTLRNVAPDHIYVVTEGKGITGTLKPARRTGVQ